MKKIMAHNTFLKKARSVHGDKYIYLSKYTGAFTKIKIKCNNPSHPFFEQTPNVHLRGRGCRICKIESDDNKMSKDEFLKAAKITHGDRYDYTESTYVSTHTPMEIRCKTHGVFKQTPYKHVSGNGCVKCIMEERIKSNKITRSEFVERVTVLHNGKYDYSKIPYGEINVTDIVTIICPTHGEFKQTAQDHMRVVNSCSLCNAHREHLDKNGFIKRARAIHGDKYCYDDVVYMGVMAKVTIHCPIHGHFTQLPNAHTRGQGCSKCAHNSKKITHVKDTPNDIKPCGSMYIELYEKTRKIKRKQRGRKNKTTADFIMMSEKIHGDRYDYSKVNYVNNKTKVTIICPMHGEFKQTPCNHLSGHGCGRCSRSTQK